MFPVEIWGTVGQWSSAVLTGGGLLIASLVYRRDSQLTRSAQAKKVHARLRNRSISVVGKVLIENYSDQRIFDIAVDVECLSLVEVAGKLRLLKRSLSNDQIIQEAADAIKDVVDRVRYTDEDNAWTIESGESFEFDIQVSDPEYQMISVVFTDVRGQRWRLKDLRAERPTLQPFHEHVAFSNPLEPAFPPTPVERVKNRLAKRKIGRRINKQGAAKSLAWQKEVRDIAKQLEQWERDRERREQETRDFAAEMESRRTRNANEE